MQLYPVDGIRKFASADMFGGIHEEHYWEWRGSYDASTSTSLWVRNVSAEVSKKNGDDGRRT